MTKTTTKQRFLSAYESYMKRMHYSEEVIEYALKDISLLLELVETGRADKFIWPQANATVVKHNNGLKVSGPFAKEL